MKMLDPDLNEPTDQEIVTKKLKKLVNLIINFEKLKEETEKVEDVEKIEIEKIRDIIKWKKHRRERKNKNKNRRDTRIRNNKIRDIADKESEELWIERIIKITKMKEIELKLKEIKRPRVIANTIKIIYSSRIL